MSKLPWQTLQCGYLLSSNHPIIASFQPFPCKRTLTQSMSVMYHLIHVLALLDLPEPLMTEMSQHKTFACKRKCIVLEKPMTQSCNQVRKRYLKQQMRLQGTSHCAEAAGGMPEGHPALGLPRSLARLAAVHLAKPEHSGTPACHQGCIFVLLVGGSMLW